MWFGADRCKALAANAGDSGCYSTSETLRESIAACWSPTFRRLKAGLQQKVHNLSETRYTNMNAVQYASELIKFDSVSAKSNVAVSQYIDGVLASLGFETEQISYDVDGVAKVSVIGRRGAGEGASGNGGVAYFGHTDVVPVEDWSIEEHGPFQPTVRDGRLYGRGSTDMKGSIACMLAAVDQLKDQELAHPIYLCCSADEELDHRGIREVIKQSEIYRQLVAGKAHGIVGEPTGMDVVYAHKGGVQIEVVSRGKAAHSSTREGLNANLAMIPFLQEVKAIYEETERDSQWWDDEFNPPTICLNIGVNDHTYAINITAPQSICTVFFRPMPRTDSETLIARLRAAADQFDVELRVNAINPSFRRDPKGEFATTCAKLSTTVAPRTVAYGSEAGDLSDIKQLIVLGPGDIAQAHKSDEWISLQQLTLGGNTYRQILEKFCCQ